MSNNKNKKVQHVETLYALRRSIRGNVGSEMMYLLAPTPKQLWDSAEATEFMGTGVSAENLRAAGWKPMKVTVVEVV